VELMVAGLECEMVFDVQQPAEVPALAPTEAELGWLG
jgi:hypothetical protein